MKILIGLFLSLNLWAQTNDNDWKDLGEMMQVYQERGSKEELIQNVRLFLLSSPVQQLSSIRSESSECQVSRSIQDLIKPELMDILFKELVQNFPFYEPQVVGCQGFLCREPIYTVIPNKKNLEEAKKWDELSRWMNQEISSKSIDPDSPYFKKTRGAFKAYTLIKSISRCRLPRSSMGSHASEYEDVWRAVEYTIDPESENSRHGYIIISGGRDLIPIVRLLETVQKLKAQLE